MENYTQDFIQETARRIQLVRGGIQPAISHLRDRLERWTGDTRRDGDTPKEFWELVLTHLQLQDTLFSSRPYVECCCEPNGLDGASLALKKLNSALHS